MSHMCRGNTGCGGRSARGTVESGTTVAAVIELICTCGRRFWIARWPWRVRAKCDRCGTYCDTGINFEYEIGAPEPFPVGLVLTRANWEADSRPGHRRKCTLILSENDGQFLLSYYEALHEGRHPVRLRHSNYSDQTDARSAFDTEYERLRHG